MIFRRSRATICHRDRYRLPRYLIVGSFDPLDESDRRRSVERLHYVKMDGAVREATRNAVAKRTRSSDDSTASECVLCLVIPNFNRRGARGTALDGIAVLPEPVASPDDRGRAPARRKSARSSLMGRPRPRRPRGDGSVDRRRGDNASTDGARDAFDHAELPGLLIPGQLLPGGRWRGLAGGSVAAEAIDDGEGARRSPSREKAVSKSTVQMTSAGPSNVGRPGRLGRR
jgi:hypothetical protein